MGYKNNLLAVLIVVLTLSFIPSVQAAPRLLVIPRGGPPNSKVIVTGNGFTPLLNGLIWFDSNPNRIFDASEVSVEVIVTARGTISLQNRLTVPFVPQGDYEIIADIPSGGNFEAITKYRVRPGIFLSSRIGYAGLEITVSGAGFAPATPGRLWLDANNNLVYDAGEPHITPTTLANGNISSANLTVPDVSMGIYFVRADLPQDGVVDISTPFIVKPRIILSQDRGLSNNTITVSGSGFTPGASGHIWFDSNGNNLKDDDEPQVAVGPIGSETLLPSVNLIIPDKPLGLYQLVADIPTGGEIEASKPFWLGNRANILPEKGTKGTDISIFGYGFEPQAEGIVWFDTNKNSLYDVSEPKIRVTVPSTGNFTDTITVPDTTADGYLIGFDIPQGGSIEAFSLFQVEPSIAFQPHTASPGARVSLSGSGFKPNTSGRAWFDINRNFSLDIFETPFTLNILPDGTVPPDTKILVPLAVPGVYPVVVDIPAHGTIELVETFEIEGHLTIFLTVKPGWNLINFPLLPSDNSRDSVLNDLYQNQGIDSSQVIMWEYEAVEGRYKRVDSDTPLDYTKGYWIRVRNLTAEMEIEIIGEPPQLREITLVPGWNLIGAMNIQEVTLAKVRVRWSSTSGIREERMEEAIREGIIRSSIWAYTGNAYQRIELLSKIPPLQGFWLRANANSTLIIPASD